MPIKYEHPPKVATEVFALLIPSELACAIALTTGNLLEQTGSKVSVLEWDYALGKGSDDVLAEKGLDFLDHLLESRLSLSEYHSVRPKSTPSTSSLCGTRSAR